MPNVKIPGHGMYVFDADLYDVALTRTRADLYAQVKSATEGMQITGLAKLRKFELAAMVAEWATGARENERYAKVQQAKDRFSTGTLVTVVDTEPVLSATPFRNNFNVSIAGTVVGHIVFRPDTGTWSAYVQGTDEDEWVGGGWTREGCVLALEDALANRDANAETSGQGSFTGDLGVAVQEAHGHARDCGRSYETDAHALSYVANTYAGGLFGFVMDISPLF